MIIVKSKTLVSHIIFCDVNYIRNSLYSRTEHVMTNGCVALKAPTFHWEPQHCGEIKDFICEQTRCYYYNYGSIPVSSAQG